jgi:nitrogen fixation protein FixH
MKKICVVIMVVVLAASVLVGCSKGYESQKRVGDMGITLKVDRYPLVKGDNALSVQVAEQGGKTVTDATVNVRYSMPPMSGMAPMEFNTQAAPKGGGYSFAANIPMEGGWKVEVTVTQPGKTPVNATFNIDAR